MIRLSKPDIREEDIERAAAVLRTGMLVQGERVDDFERGLEAFSGLPHAVAVSSGTAALHLAYRALGIGPGDAVLAPAFTFPATTNAAEVLGAETVLCDVDARSYVATPETIEEGIDRHGGEGRLKAVAVVHEFGYPCRIAEIAELCRKKGLKLLEDAACALGTVADGRHPGHYGDAACFSFHPRKAITTGEGGAVLTRSEELAGAVATLRNHGMVKKAGGLDFLEAGLNYRLTDFQAALALGQMDRFREELVLRRRHAAQYAELLRNEPRLLLPEIPAGHSLQSFMVVLDEGIERAEVIRVMAEKGVQANLGAQAIHCLAHYRGKYGWAEEAFPAAARLYRSGLVLPMYGLLGADDIRLVCEALGEALDRGEAFGRAGRP